MKIDGRRRESKANTDELNLELHEKNDKPRRDWQTEWDERSREYTKAYEQSIREANERLNDVIQRVHQQ